MLLYLFCMIVAYIQVPKSIVIIDKNTIFARVLMLIDCRSRRYPTMYKLITPAQLVTNEEKALDRTVKYTVNYMLRNPR